MGSSSSVPSYSVSFSNSTTASPPPPSPPSSPSRFNGKSDGEERPRFFDGKAKNKCWANADIVPGRHPERWRKDAAGNVVCKRFGNCSGCLCFEYDHIVPYSKGSILSQLPVLPQLNHLGFEINGFYDCKCLLLDC